jgi:hypothetical protein
MNQPSDGMNGRDIGVQNLGAFKAWIAERDAANDWCDYVRGAKLNRSEIAAECGFALSVLRQNPAVKAALMALEDRLQSCGTFTAPVAPSTSSEGEIEDASALAVDRRIMVAKRKLEERVKSLEEKNATLRAEVSTLREELAKYQHLENHLCRTGRLLPP